MSKRTIPPSSEIQKLNNEESDNRPRSFLKYLNIPIDDIFYDSRISLLDTFLLSIIYILEHPDYGCYASNAYLGKLLKNRNPQTISNRINHLEQLGYLKITNPKGKYRQIKVSRTYKKSYRYPIRKVIANINRYNNNISKDILLNEQSSSTMNKFIDYWNNKLDNPPFKHLKIDTKTYKNTVTYFNRLQKGTFYNSNMDFSSLLKKHPETEKLLNKKWSDKEITRALFNCSKLYNTKYWPPDKTKLPKSIEGLLYSPYGKTSFFILQAKTVPGLLQAKIKDANPNLTKIFIKLLNLTVLSYNQKILINNISKIVLYHSKMRHTSQIDSALGEKEYPMKFCRKYISWLKLEYEDWEKGFTVNMIGPGSNSWKNWIKYCQQEWDI